MRTSIPGRIPPSSHPSIQIFGGANFAFRILAWLLFSALPLAAGIVSFTASRSTFLPGQEILLTWEITPGDVASIAPTVGPLTTSSGTFSVIPTANTTFTLTDTTSGTSAAVSVTMIKAGTVKNRWSFNEGSGTTVIDSVGAQNGVIIPSSSGNNYSRTSTTVNLPGGSSSSKAYIDLPNNLLSGLEAVTLEGWMTPTGNRTWQRAFDFGSNSAGEVTNRGGSFSGTEYLFLALQNSGDTAVKVPSIKDDNNEQNTSVADALNTGTEFHFAYVYDPAGNAGSPQIRYYKNGTLITSVNTPHVLASITNHNNWLGRSNWSADSNTQANYNEFRIWNRALSAQRIADNSTAGADALPTNAAIESFTAFPSTTVEIGQQVRLSYIIANPSGGSVVSSIDQGVGTVTGTEGYATVTPTTTTTYTLSVTAGGVTRTQNITITTVAGSAPVAENLQVRTPWQTAAPVTLIANDYQTTSLSYSIVTPPSSGVLSGSPPNLTYTPNAGFSGQDAFTYRASDGVYPSNTAAVSITVLPAPSAPTAVTLSENVIYSDSVAGSFVGRLRSTDANPDDSFTYTLVPGTGSTHNSWFTIQNGQLLANHSFSGDVGATISIRVRSQDSAGLSVEQVLLVPVEQRPLSVVINEINYNPADNSQETEYIELHNPGPSAVDVGNWRLADAVTYTIPPGTSIPAGGYLVIAENPAALSSWHSVTSLGPWTGNLASEGELIELRDAGGLLIDSAEYANTAPWPATPNGSGPSLELANPLLENNLGGNWNASTVSLGSTVYFAKGATDWKYFKGTSEPSTPIGNWRNEGFADSAWTTGQTPIGIFKQNSNTASSGNAETGVTLATQINDMATYSGSSFAVSYRSVYLRKTFQVTGAIPSALTMRVMHNDAAIVYVNGVEVARFGFTPGSPANVPFNYTGIYENGNDPWSEFLWVNPGSVLHPGTNTIAIQAFAKPPTLRSDQEDWGSYNVFDFCVDAELRTPTEAVGTPGSQNSTYTANSTPPVRDVNHSPKAPKPWEPIKVTARISDAQGLGNIQLAYQLCTPGNYIPATLPRTVSQILAAPYDPAPENPAFEDSANWTFINMTDNGGLSDTAGDGVFTATIPAQPHRTLIRYRILATDLTGNSVRIPSATDPRRNFAAYSYNRVPTYTAGGSTFGPASLESLPVYQWLTRASDFSSLLAYNSSEQFANSISLAALEARRNENFVGTMVVGDQVMDHTEVRLRGGNSRYYGSGKRHFRFNFPKGTYLEARDEKGKKLPGRWESLLFNKCFGNKGAYDFGMPYEVGGKLWSLQGVPMPESVFIHFRVVRDSDENNASNGDFWGLYQALELPEGNNFLDARGLPAGNFYKTSDWMQNGEMDKRYQAKGGVRFAEDFENIRYNIHQNTPQADVENYINMPLWYRYNAVQEAIRHYDIFTEPTGRHRVKNLIWYFHPKAGTNGFGQLWYIPYDWDASFGPNWNNGWCNTHNAIYNHNSITDSPTWSQPSPDRTSMKIEHRNHIREFRDLLWYRDTTSGRGPVDDIIDDAYNAISLFYQADMARWPNNTGAAAHWAGGAPAKVQDMKNFAFVGWTDPFGSDPSVGSGGRAAHLDSITDTIDSGLLPSKPTISYSGTSGYPIDGLAFSTTAFSDPQGAGTFAAMQWRIGEVTDPSAPEYDALAPRIYEVTPVWESGRLTTSQPNTSIPATALRKGHTYRARVRYQDNTGRWGHWSAPIQFTTTVGNYLATLQQNLMITEVMYNPLGPALPGGSKEDYEFIELRNVSDVITLDLSGVRFTKGVDFNFSNGTITSLAPGAQVLVVKNLTAFQARYGTHLPVAGVWDAADNLSNSGEQLKLSYGEGDAIHDFEYDDAAPWPVTPDGAGPSLVLIDPVSRPDHALASNWQASVLAAGSPGSEDNGFAFWLASQGESNPLADPDGDGMNHLLNYALGGDLLADPLSALPVVSLTTNGGDTYLTMVFRIRSGASGVTVTPELSTDLAAWQSGVTVFEEAAPPISNPDGTTTVSVRSVQPVSSQSAAFARLRVNPD